MEEKKDILKRHIISSFKQEAPSFDFTEVVMNKIEKSVTDKKIVPPLISNRAWAIVFTIAFLVLISSLGLEIKKVEIHLFDGFNFPKVTDFIVTIKLFFVISMVLGLITMIDLFYRKSKQLA